MSNFFKWVLITQIHSVNVLFFNKKAFNSAKKINLFKTNQVQCSVTTGIKYFLILV